MKHLNEFEEFDPNDFGDFEQGHKDLKNLGFNMPVEGINWGFGPDLKGKNDGKTPLYLSQMVVDFLAKKGIISNIFNGDQFFIDSKGSDMLDKYLEQNFDLRSHQHPFTDVDFYKARSYRFGEYSKYPEGDGEFYLCYIYDINENSKISKEFPLGKDSKFMNELDQIPPSIVKMIYEFFKYKLEEK